MQLASYIMDSNKMVSTRYQRSASLLEYLLSVTIGVTLCISAVAHLENPYQFLAAVIKYQAVSNGIAECMAATLPFFQLVIAYKLQMEQSRRPAFLASAILFAIYSTAQGFVYYRGGDIDCGCFGLIHDPDPIGIKSIGLAVGLLLLSSIGYLLASIDSRSKSGTPVSVDHSGRTTVTL